MATKFDELVEAINKKLSQIQSINIEIDAAKLSFERYMERMSEILQNNNQEYLELMNQTISVKFEDLLLELSSITGLSLLETNIEVRTNIFLDENESLNTSIVRKYAENNNLEIVLKGNSNNSKYFYCIVIPLNFNKTQADGKPLIDHCAIKENINNFYDEKTYEIIVDKGITDIICEFRMGNLLNNNITSFGLSKEILKQAIINTYNKCNQSPAAETKEI